MKDTIDQLISFLEADNKDFQSLLTNKTLQYQYSKATDEEIREFEKQFDLVLPSHLKEFYKNINATMVNFMFISILGIPKIIADYNLNPNLTDLVNDKIIPIANDNGNLICVDTNQSKDQLLHFEHEDGSLSETYISIEVFLQDLIKQKIEHIKDSKTNA